MTYMKMKEKELKLLARILKLRMALNKTALTRFYKKADFISRTLFKEELVNYILYIASSLDSSYKFKTSKVEMISTLNQLLNKEESELIVDNLLVIDAEHPAIKIDELSVSSDFYTDSKISPLINRVGFLKNTYSAIEVTTFALDNCPEMVSTSGEESCVNFSADVNLNSFELENVGFDEVIKGCYSNYVYGVVSIQLLPFMSGSNNLSGMLSAYYDVPASKILRLERLKSDLSALREEIKAHSAT